MAISEISGVAGTISGGGGGRGGGGSMEGFAEQLLRAREFQQKSDMANLDAAMKIATYDPQAAEEIGGKALKSLGKTSGKSPSEMLFSNIFEEAKKSRELGAKKEQAEITHLDAETQAALERAGYEKSQAGLTKLQTDYEASIQASEKALQNPDLPPDQRAQHALNVSVGRKLPEELTNVLMLSPKQRKDYFAAKETKLTAEAAQEQLKYASMIADFRDAQGRSMTPDQSAKFLESGQLPPGFDSPAHRDELLKARQVGAQEMQARAAASEAGTAARRERAESAERIARAYKELADSEYKLKHGDKTENENLIKAFEAAAKAKDKALTKGLSEELAARFGLEPTEVKSLFGLWTSKGYTFTGGTGAPGKEADPSALGDVPPAKESTAFQRGRAIPAGIGSAYKTGVEAASEGLLQGASSLEQFLRGIVNVPGATIPDPSTLAPRP